MSFLVALFINSFVFIQTVCHNNELDQNIKVFSSVTTHLGLLQHLQRIFVSPSPQGMKIKVEILTSL